MRTRTRAEKETAKLSAIATAPEVEKEALEKTDLHPKKKKLKQKSTWNHLKKKIKQERHKVEKELENPQLISERRRMQFLADRENAEKDWQKQGRIALREQDLRRRRIRLSWLIY